MQHTKHTQVAATAEQLNPAHTTTQDTIAE